MSKGSMKLIVDDSMKGLWRKKMIEQVTANSFFGSQEEFVPPTGIKWLLWKAKVFKNRWSDRLSRCWKILTDSEDDYE